MIHWKRRCPPPTSHWYGPIAARWAPPPSGATQPCPPIEKFNCTGWWVGWRWDVAVWTKYEDWGVNLPFLTQGKVRSCEFAWLGVCLDFVSLDGARVRLCGAEVDRLWSTAMQSRLLWCCSVVTGVKWCKGCAPAYPAALLYGRAATTSGQPVKMHQSVRCVSNLWMQRWRKVKVSDVCQGRSCWGTFSSPSLKKGDSRV